MWRAKYRLPDGRQVQRTIGKVWTERGRPPEAYFTKRTAEAWLRDVLDQAERGGLPGMVRTGRTFANATLRSSRARSRRSQLRRLEGLRRRPDGGRDDPIITEPAAGHVVSGDRPNRR